MRKFHQITPDEDAPLLLSWYRGDLSAFETVVRKYQKRIFNLALLLTGSHQTASEATESSFLLAFQNIKLQKSTVRFSSWLMGIALKECRELIDYRFEDQKSSVDIDESLPDVSSYSSALHKKLEQCIRALPFELSELILLRYVRGYSLERIEEILQINGDQLLSRLFEAQGTLACWLRSDTEIPEDLAPIKMADSSFHPEIRRNFSAYLDSSIEVSEKELTKSHLKSCGSCREALAELEWMVEDIKSFPDAEPPHWLASSIMQKVKSLPVKPVKVKPVSHLKIQLSVALLFIFFIAASSHLILKKSEILSEPPRTGGLQVTPPSVHNSDKDEAGFSPGAKTVFKGAVNRSESSPENRSLPIPSVPLPSTLPSDLKPQPVPVPGAIQPEANVKNETVQKRDSRERIAPSLPEWGDPPQQNRPAPNRAPMPRQRSGETSVLISIAEPASAAHDIEGAVIALGGRVTGRAYSSGNDILYTRVDSEKFFDLMSRLSKIGRIQDLPQLPEGAEGDLDLTIRW